MVYLWAKKNMQIIPQEISGLLLIQPDIFIDERGYFFESYHIEKLRLAGIDKTFVQDNESLSAKGTIRGLHFQNPPFAQAKLVRVIRGSVFDVAVDIRQNSPTYGKWIGHILDDKNKRMFFIPEGFAHGFAALEDQSIVLYKCTSFYNKASEGSIRWNDPELNIHWNIDVPLVSAKDQLAPFFSDLVSQFLY